jgi:hypothetical protein
MKILNQGSACCVKVQRFCCGQEKLAGCLAGVDLTGVADHQYGKLLSPPLTHEQQSDLQLLNRMLEL